MAIKASKYTRSFEIEARAQAQGCKILKACPYGMYIVLGVQNYLIASHALQFKLIVIAKSLQSISTACWILTDHSRLQCNDILNPNVPWIYALNVPECAECDNKSHTTAAARSQVSDRASPRKLEILPRYCPPTLSDYASNTSHWLS